jgi:hypothetical protein
MSNRLFYCKKEEKHMKKLIFKDGTSIDVVDSSTPLNLVAVVSKYADLDALNLNAENVEGATLDGVPLDVKYGSNSATSDGGAVRLTIVNREKTADEKLDDKITDITDILAMLLMGGAEDGEEIN